MRAFLWPDAPPPARIAAALRPRGRFWLDGWSAHREGRWSFLGAEPREVRAVSWPDDPRPALAGLGASGADGLALGVEVPEWVGWLAYDAAWAMGDALGLRRAPRLARSGVPLLWLGRYDALFAHDGDRDETFVLAADELQADALRARIGRGAAVGRVEIGRVAHEDEALHHARIVAALEAIAAGELYQVNLARPYAARFRGDALALFLAMRDASPVPLGAFVETAETAVLARTMERFLAWDPASRELLTRPIKGTIARSGADDAADALALARDDKERAEHAMIVDLMRNDLSRVAEVGSVRVEEPLRVEPFRGLCHLVSTVRCRTQAGVSLPALIEATFPPGSVTGTPKLSAIERIEALEERARGIYTGAIGYVGRRGGVSLAVAIRTAVVHGGEALYFAGGGLVSASDPEREIAETRLKARAFLDALEALDAGAVP